MRRNARIVIMLLFFAGIALALAGFFLCGWTRTWAWFRVVALNPPFADLRTVQGALISLAQGFDPRVLNPGDPWGRAMNYPMVWVKLARVFHLANENNYLWFVSCYAVAYLVCVCDLLRKTASFWVLAAFFSSASLLALERGNNDLVVFALLYVAAMCPVLWFAGIAILAGTALKIYPLFASISLLKNRLVFGVLVFASIILLALNFRDVLGVKSVTPVGAAGFYGTPSIAIAIQTITRISVSPLMIGALLLILAGTLSASKALKRYCEMENPEEWEVRLFLTGAGVYAGTFLFSSNYDYRLIFVILCIPYMAHLSDKWVRRFVLSQVIVSSNLDICMKLLGRPIGLLLTMASKIILFVFVSAFLMRELSRLFPEFSTCERTRHEAQGVQA